MAEVRTVGLPGLGGPLVRRMAAPQSEEVNLLASSAKTRSLTESESGEFIDLPADGRMPYPAAARGR